MRTKARCRFAFPASRGSVSRSASGTKGLMTRLSIREGIGALEHSMPNEREQRSQNSDDGISRVALMRWLSDSGNLRLLLSALYARRRSIRSGAPGSERTAAEE